jgi:hypothetical protein
MRFVLSLIVAVTVLGAIQASSEEIALGVSPTSVDNRVTVGSSRNDCSDGDWNTANRQPANTWLRLFIVYRVC